MTDLSPLVREAFQDDSLPPADRDRLWSTMQHRHARQARLKLVIRAGLLLLAGLVIAVYAFLRTAVTSSDHVGPIAMTADSTSNSPADNSMIQETLTHQEVLTNLMPLLAHRSQIISDIEDLETRQLQLAGRLPRTSGREHDVIEGQLASVEQQLESSRIALRVIDAQLAGQPVPVTNVTTSIAPPQVFTFGGGGVPDEVLYTAGGVGALLVLGMFAMLGYMRRVARTMRGVLTAIENQVSSQHATLASGIDAIAVEVERLGEGQRFMSKVLAGSESKPAPISRT